MVRLNRTTTTGPLVTGKCSSFTLSRSVISKDSGVEMFTIRPSRSDRAVEAEPIIWFINSQTALIDRSLSSNSSSGVSVHRRISTIAFTSLRLSIMMLLPSRPHTYLISTPTAGSIRPRTKSSALMTSTLGVVISTRWSSILDAAVAEEPKLMFMISPMASMTIGLKIISSIQIRSF